MLEALGEWMGFPAYFAGYGGKEPPRTGASHAELGYDDGAVAALRRSGAV